MVQIEYLCILLQYFLCVFNILVLKTSLHTVNYQKLYLLEKLAYTIVLWLRMLLRTVCSTNFSTIKI